MKMHFVILIATSLISSSCTAAAKNSPENDLENDTSAKNQKANKDINLKSKSLKINPKNIKAAKTINGEIAKKVPGIVEDPNPSDSTNTKTVNHHKNYKSSNAKLKQLDKTLKNVNSVKAKFTQKIHLKTADMIKNSNGELFIERPSNLRWEIKTPSNSLYISTSKARWFYTPPFDKEDQGQAIRIKSNAAEKNITLRLLSGKSSLPEEFKLIKSNKGANHIHMKPKDKKQRDAKSIELELAEDTGYPTRIVIHQFGGNTTDIRLTQVDLNQKIDSKVFQFNAPKGTAIVEQ